MNLALETASAVGVNNRHSHRNHDSHHNRHNCAGGGSHHNRHNHAGCDSHHCDDSHRNLVHHSSKADRYHHQLLLPPLLLLARESLHHHLELLPRRHRLFDFRGLVRLLDLRLYRGLGHVQLLLDTLRMLF